MTAKKKKTITVVLCEPGAPARAVEVENDLAPMQKLVGGYIEAKASRVLSKDRLIVYCWDEDATMKAKPPPPNRPTEYGMILGPFFVVAQVGAEFASLTKAEIERALAAFNG